MSALPDFRVDREQHSYHLGSRELVSVTTVLGLLDNFDTIPRHILEHARERGSQVHAAINLYNRGGFYPTTFRGRDDELVSYVDAWKKFLEDTEAVIVASEQAVYHADLGFAGTPDCVLSWKKDKRLLIPDVKVTHAVPPTVGAQTAAYAVAYRAMFGGKEPDRACVHLKPGGRYELHMRSDLSDWTLFQSTLNVYRFLEKHR